MGTAKQDYATDAFSFIEDISRMDRADAIMSAFHRRIAAFGFSTFIMTGLPNPAQRFEQLVMLKHWPAEWYDAYTKGAYVFDDPVACHCHRTVEPFEWADAPVDPQRAARSRMIMGSAADLGMARGYCVPIHGLMGFEAAVSLGGEDIDPTPRAKECTHLMAVYAFNRVRRLLSPAARDAKPALSEREREVLAWAAAGKSSWEIGRILSISNDTANKHIAAAIRKMGASNKTQAVAEALRRREIAY